jgi:hypothetical protein
METTKKEENFIETVESAEDKVSITNEEIEFIAEKIGYSTATVQGVLRGYIPRIPRHQPIFDLYEKVKYLRELHLENYKKDLQNL